MKKKYFLIFLSFFIYLFSSAEEKTKYNLITIDDKIILEKQISDKKFTIISVSAKETNLNKLHENKEHIYIVVNNFIEGTNSLIKINKSNEKLKENYQYIAVPGLAQKYTYKMFDDKVLVHLHGNEYFISNEFTRKYDIMLNRQNPNYKENQLTVKVERIVKYKNYVYDTLNSLWIPLNEKMDFVQNQEISTVFNWFYDGKLKRWYPLDYFSRYKENIWIEKTPTQEMVNFMHQLWDRSRSGEDVDYFAEFTKIFKREKKNDLLLKSKNNDRTENSKKMKNDNISNTVNDVKILSENENPKSKFFIILAILLIAIFGAFLIKNRKKKRMKLKVKLSQIQ